MITIYKTRELSNAAAFKTANARYVKEGNEPFNEDEVKYEDIDDLVLTLWETKIVLNKELEKVVVLDEENFIYL